MSAKMLLSILQFIGQATCYLLPLTNKNSLAKSANCSNNWILGLKPPSGLCTSGFTHLLHFWILSLDVLFSYTISNLLHQNLGGIASLKGWLHCLFWEISKLLTSLLHILMLCASADTRDWTASLQSGGTFRHVKVWKSTHMCARPSALSDCTTPWQACLAFPLEQMPSLCCSDWSWHTHLERITEAKDFSGHSEFTHTSFTSVPECLMLIFPMRNFLLGP